MIRAFRGAAVLSGGAGLISGGVLGAGGWVWGGGLGAVLNNGVFAIRDVDHQAVSVTSKGQERKAG